ncbi:MAG TPA: HAMP domain-containing sensor histidine kinase [Gemmataceae bacterium]|nr:HAMP domain-containing sensor histidine kinase [Gemmataceae bacterium]
MTTPVPGTQGAAATVEESSRTRRVGHVFLDVRRRVLLCLNGTARRLHKEGVPFTPADLTNRQLYHLTGDSVRPDDLPLIVSWREARSVETTLLLERPASPTYHVCWNTAPTRDASGHVIGVLATVTVSPPEPDFRRLAELAHDLRTPLQAIGMLASVLESPPPESELRETLLRIRAAAGRALEVSRDLLEFSRNPGSRGRPVTPTWFALRPYLARLAEEQLVEAQRKSLTLHVDLAAIDDTEVYCDRVRLGRLLSNLLSNAVRYTARGRVEFTAAWRDGPEKVLALGVVDTGAGIDPDEQDSIFEPFERGRAGKMSDSSGSGVGLASVDNLVRELGLNLEVYSEHNRGSAFHLLLPAHILRHKAGDASESR